MRGVPVCISVPSQSFPHKSGLKIETAKTENYLNTMDEQVLCLAKFLIEPRTVVFPGKY